MTRWEKIYQEDERVLTAPPSCAVRRAMTYFQRSKTRRILDIGCGVGRDTAILAMLPAIVVGVEIAKTGLARVHQQTIDKANTRFICADARALPLSTGQFDGVYCFGMLHEFSSDDADADVAAVMHEIARVLAPNGIVILAALAGAPAAGLPHVRLFDAERWQAATRGFSVIESDTQCDIGCTGSRNYTVWFGAFRKPEERVRDHDPHHLGI
jgi:SAM-dependent methyltransferase